MIDGDDMRPATEEDVRRFKQCVGKTPLSSRRAAHLRHVMGYRPYRCQFCGAWHVAKTASTKQTRVRRRRRRKWGD